MHLLILAGTGEARTIIKALKDDMRINITASLAGATPSPIDLMVPTRKGGFGGATGLADFCRTHNVDAIIDLTHPYAAQMSRNANDAAAMAEVKLIRFMRPAWQAGKGDSWQYFENWHDMAKALPIGARVFLAGGSGALAVFSQLDHVDIWARGLNQNNNTKSNNNGKNNEINSISEDLKRLGLEESKKRKTNRNLIEYEPTILIETTKQNIIVKDYDGMAIVASQQPN